MPVISPKRPFAAVRPAEERTFATHDGSAIFYRRWRSATPDPRGAIVLLHRGHEHGGRLEHIVEELGLDAFDFYAWDARDHGRSDGRRGGTPSFAAAVRDLDRFIADIRARDGFASRDIAIVAQSVGAVLAAGWVHDYAPDIRAMVLAAPAFEVKLYVPFARAAIALRQAVSGPFQVKSYVKGRFLTRDAERIASFEADPLIAKPIASTMLLDLGRSGARLVEDARAITVPVQLLVSGNDQVVRKEPQHAFFVALGSPVKERHVLAGFRHDTLGERDRAQAFELVRGFLSACFGTPHQPVPLRDADRAGHTRDESERLATPLSRLSVKGIGWAAARLGVRLGASLSVGMRTGVDFGFDSGATLDYVYRNRAEGRAAVGRAVDRLFLDAIGWRGIRRRKANLEIALGTAMSRLANDGTPVHLVDVAAGHGRYVLDAATATTNRPETILLRDFSSANVDAGRRAIHDRGLSGLARFEQGDAFDENGLAALAPRPTLAVVSGLFELYADNQLVMRSLNGLARAMPRGGILVYTNQPWHPQLETIARCLTSHRAGLPWVMRRRAQGEMDQLVDAAGFRKLDQWIDDWGMFTVSIAERR